MDENRTIRVSRAPVLTLWAAVVAERLGFDRDEALTLGRAVAGSSAAMKGKALGIFEPSDPRDVEAERRKAPLGRGRPRPVTRPSGAGGPDACRHPRARQGQAEQAALSRARRGAVASSKRSD